MSVGQGMNMDFFSAEKAEKDRLKKEEEERLASEAAEVQADVDEEAAVKEQLGDIPKSRQATASGQVSTLAGARRRKQSRSSGILENTKSEKGSISRRTLLGF